MINWKKGRGKLGVFEPLIGSWICNEGSKERMKPQVIRTFAYSLGKNYIMADVTWFLGDKNYEDHTIIGLDSSKIITSWSFTSDGKNSVGKLTDVSDVHESAFGFESIMPAGIARQMFWPDEKDGFNWAVESKTQKGWNRFVLLHFREYKK